MARRTAGDGELLAETAEPIGDADEFGERLFTG